MIEFILTFEGRQLTLPINPATFKIAREGKNSVVELIGIGDVAVPKGLKLAEITIESMFPADGVTTPGECVEFIMDAWRKGKYMTLTVTEILEEAMPVIVTAFTRERRAGEHEDIYYTLELMEYRPYGATAAGTIAYGVTAYNAAYGVMASAAVRSDENKPAAERYYTVKRGDTLWSIARRSGGDWRELYENNKSVIGANPDYITVGTILNMPESWVSAS
ncbi:MAG: LysM peptidoglycan-binding domain-containing protein [Clostridiales bacterium]|nr:LysM peptidoglycan-binding domain-containing protein [Clostridiales bacterium]